MKLTEDTADPRLSARVRVPRPCRWRACSATGVDVSGHGCPDRAHIERATPLPKGAFRPPKFDGEQAENGDLDGARCSLADNTASQRRVDINHRWTGAGVPDGRLRESIDGAARIASLAVRHLPGRRWPDVCHWLTRIYLRRHGLLATW
jgi:hypothetical protein